MNWETALIWTKFSGFQHSLQGMCALLGFYAAWDGSFLPAFWHDLPIPSWNVKHLRLLDPSWWDGSDILSRKVLKKLTILSRVKPQKSADLKVVLWLLITVGRYRLEEFSSCLWQATSRPRWQRPKPNWTSSKAKNLFMQNVQKRKSYSWNDIENKCAVLSN
jgi:hypothetical protein